MPGAPPRRHPGAAVGDILDERHLLGALLAVFATAVLCAPLVTFSAVLVRRSSTGAPAASPPAVAAFGAGGLLGAIGLLGVAPSVDRRRLSSWFALGHGAVLVLTALTPWFWGIPPLLALAGASMTVSNTAANSVLQATGSPRLLGQTVCLYMLATRGGISLGALLTGAAVGRAACAPPRRAAGRDSGGGGSDVVSHAPPRPQCRVTVAGRGYQRDRGRCRRGRLAEAAPSGGRRCDPGAGRAGRTEQVACPSECPRFPPGARTALVVEDEGDPPVHPDSPSRTFKRRITPLIVRRPTS